MLVYKVTPPALVESWSSLFAVSAKGDEAVFIPSFSVKRLVSHLAENQMWLQDIFWNYFSSVCFTTVKVLLYLFQHVNGGTLRFLTTLNGCCCPVQTQRSLSSVLIIATIRANIQCGLLVVTNNGAHCKKKTPYSFLQLCWMIFIGSSPRLNGSDRFNQQLSTISTLRKPTMSVSDACSKLRAAATGGNIVSVIEINNEQDLRLSNNVFVWFVFWNVLLCFEVNVCLT